MRIFLICSVRNSSEEERAAQLTYVQKLEATGNEVHWPSRDTDQEDPIGFKICETNRAAIESADEVHVLYNPASEGTAFDLAMASAFKKRIVFVEGEEAASRCSYSIRTIISLFETYKELSLRWNPAARIGSIEVLGVAFALRKKLSLANPEVIQPTPHKSFENVLLAFTGKL